MQIAVACSQCGYQYSVDRDFIGRSVECQQCQNQFVIKEPESEIGLVPEEPSARAAVSA